MLILSDQLCHNRDRNLTERQVEFAKTIHSSGNDLLTLINDILDLSKIESGTVELDLSELRFDDLGRYVERTFRHFAESKNLEFALRLDPRLPRSMVTDSKRLQQILKNLLSNAFKFTHRGEVALTIEPVAHSWDGREDDPNTGPETVAFTVSDTGIGISAEKQLIVFEAFQQADGSTSRKYGGTGLGLAISRELSTLLGGEIRLLSGPGRGSSFTLYLPVTYTAPRGNRRTPPVSITETGEAVQSNDRWQPFHPTPQPRALADPLPEPAALTNEANDDRDNIQPGDTVWLIVENDMAFARFLLEAVREKGCKGLVALQGAVALALARDYMLDAITLDIVLPDMDGWRVMDRLKNDLSTRHIPVCVVSTEDARAEALDMGAVGFIAKPIPSKALLDEALQELLGAIKRPTKRVVIIEGNDGALDGIVASIAGDDVVIKVAKGADALSGGSLESADCLIIDDSLSVNLHTVDRGAENFLRRRLPVIVWSGQEESSAQAHTRYSNFTVRHVQSSERLIDQLALFLHRRTTRLPESQHRQVEALHASDAVLSGRKVLIVDDDVRNIFALASLLEEHGMMAISAGNGRDALRIMSHQNVDIVLMDIMMPDMDGMATVREARKIPSCRNLPIIAVTAKAMKGDRDRCIEAGAWDYLSKPVDSRHLLSVLRSWLHR